MLDYYEAQEKLLSTLAPVGRLRLCALTEANGGVLAERVCARYDAPQFDNSAMDGYALCGGTSAHSRWEVVGRIAAGHRQRASTLKAGQAARIFTGAPVPAGTYAVIQQERTQIIDGYVHVEGPVKEGENIRRRSEELGRGCELVGAGERLTPGLIALLASQGYGRVNLFSPLTISVFSSGDELVDIGQPLGEGRIYDSNRYLLLTWLRNSQHRVVDGGILPDKRQDIREALLQASEVSDVIITSGGVSVGEEDHIKSVIQEIGRLVSWKVAIKPGKPFAWGELGGSTVFMLPGNPVSSLVVFQQMVGPALRRLAGEAQCQPHFIKVRSGFATERPNERREFLRVVLRNSEQGLIAHRLAGQGSAMLSALTEADGLAELPPGSVIGEGDLVNVYPLHYAAI